MYLCLLLCFQDIKKRVGSNLIKSRLDAQTKENVEFLLVYGVPLTVDWSF